MFTVETLETDNRIISTLLYTLENQGFVTIINEEEMGETTLHNKLLRYLTDCLELFLSQQPQTFVAANLNFYYDPENLLKWYAPDVLIAFGIPNRERSSYRLNDEIIVPQVIFEIASQNTYDNDLGKKYAEYARLGVEEYYLLDPERDLLPLPLMAFQRQKDSLAPVVVENRRVLSPRLGLEIVDTRETFRLFNPATNKFLSSAHELAEEKAALEIRIAELETRLREN